jgi:hypothetical protein
VVCFVVLAKDERVGGCEGGDALFCREGVAADVCGAVEAKSAADLVVCDEFLEFGRVERKMAVVA